MLLLGKAGSHWKRDSPGFSLLLIDLNTIMLTQNACDENKLPPHHRESVFFFTRDHFSTRITSCNSLGSANGFAQRLQRFAGTRQLRCLARNAIRSLRAGHHDQYHQQNFHRQHPVSPAVRQKLRQLRQQPPVGVVAVLPANITTPTTRVSGVPGVPWCVGRVSTHMCQVSNPLVFTVICC